MCVYCCCCLFVFVRWNERLRCAHTWPPLRDFYRHWISLDFSCPTFQKAFNQLSKLHFYSLASTTSPVLFMCVCFVFIFLYENYLNKLSASFWFFIWSAKCRFTDLWQYKKEFCAFYFDFVIFALKLLWLFVIIFRPNTNDAFFFFFVRYVLHKY